MPPQVRNRAPNISVVDKLRASKKLSSRWGIVDVKDQNF